MCNKNLRLECWFVAWHDIRDVSVAQKLLLLLQCLVLGLARSGSQGPLKDLDQAVGSDFTAVSPYPGSNCSVSASASLRGWPPRWGVSEFTGTSPCTMARLPTHQRISALLDLKKLRRKEGGAWTLGVDQGTSLPQRDRDHEHARARGYVVRVQMHTLRREGLISDWPRIRWIVCTLWDDSTYRIG